MSELFKDFKPVSAKEWKQKIQADLKGKDYGSLISKTYEGIDVKPFYHPDDHQKSHSAHAEDEWKISTKIELNDRQKNLAQIEKGLKKGIEHFWFIPSGKFNLEKFLAEIDFGTTPLLFDFTKTKPKTPDLENLINCIKENNLKAQINVDPIGYLTGTGNYFDNQKEDFLLNASLIEKYNQPVGISGQVYQNAGANAVQQIAYSVAHAVEYLHYLDNKNPDLPAQTRFQFKIAMGSDYFMEIAKLRALRVLYRHIAKAFKAPEQCEILAFPTQRNKSIYDYNINLLRTTTEAMSAVLGGADIISNAPYDEIYHNPNDFGDRISRNQLLILKHESYFNAVKNPAEGSYYIENLTENMGKKALNLVQMIEKSGGFLKNLHSGKIQQKIKESAQQQQEDFDKGKLKLVGVNTFENPEDRMKNELERRPFPQKNKRKTIIEPIISKRLAEKIEQKRLKEEQSNKK